MDDDTEGLSGQYANYFQIGNNAFEFVIDFGQLYDEQEKARFHTRIITNPIYAKELLNTLEESIKTFERKYREIGDEER